LVKTLFRDGDPVKKGDLLFEIDPRPYQVQLDQATGQLKLHEASLKLAQATLTRNQTLAKSTPGAISQTELDQSMAAVQEAEARLLASRASLEVAKLNLDFTRISSPIDGRTSRQLLTIGNLVTADTTLLTTVVSTDPIYVYFDMDERTVLRLRRSRERMSVRENSWPAQVGLVDEAGYPRTGVIDFTDNRIDPATGTLRVRAVLPNTDRLLMPGMFVRIRLATSQPHKALLVPEEAIGSDQGMKYVFVVDDRNQVVYRRVTVGPLQDGQRVVTEGLRPDDHVIQNAISRVRPGEFVSPAMSR
jgi:RND family efflux transporter MFP subunit